MSRVRVWYSSAGGDWEQRTVSLTDIGGRRAISVRGEIFGAFCSVYHGGTSDETWVLCERVASTDEGGLACDGLCVVGGSTIPVRLPLYFTRMLNGEIVDIEDDIVPPFTKEDAVAPMGDDTSRSEVVRIATLARTLESASMLTGRSANESCSASADGFECGSVMSD